MSQPSLEHLLNLTAGPERAQLARESIQRILTCSLPPHDRALFFPPATLSPAETAILARCSTFASAGAVHLVMQFLASESKVPSAERARIHSTKAALFFPACAQRVPPPPGIADPVAQYGWARDSAAVRTMQDECAYLYLACDRLAFRSAAAPGLAPYVAAPAHWYGALAGYLLSPLYALVFLAKIKAGATGLRALLADLHTKLAVLHEAVGGHVPAAPLPHEVVVALCADVGLPALDAQHLDGQAADEIRNLFENVRNLAMHDPQFQFQINLQDFVNPAIKFDYLAIKPQLPAYSGFLGGIMEAVHDATSPFQTVIIPMLREQELVKQVRAFGESSGRQYGLWN